MAQSPHDASPEQPSPPAWKQRLLPVVRAVAPQLRRAAHWCNTHRVPATVLGMSALVMLSTVALLWMLDESPHTDEITIQDALTALDAGNDTSAVTIAEHFLDPLLLPPSQRYAPPLVFGTVLSREADATLGRHAMRLRMIAISYLERALSFGPTAERREATLYLLGKNLLETGRPLEARTMLEEALAAQTPPRHDVHRLLAKLYASPQIARYSDAAKQIELYLTGEQLTTADRQRGQLLRAEIDAQRGKLETALNSLPTFDIRSPLAAEGLFLRARLTMLAAESLPAPAAPLAPDNQAAPPRQLVPEDNPARAQLYQQAIEGFGESQRRSSLGNAIAPKSLYLSGICRLAVGDTTGALHDWDMACRRFPTTDEAAAAGFLRGELFQRLGRDQQAAEAFRVALAQSGQLINYENPWLTRNELLERSLSAYQRALDERRFFLAASLAESLMPLVGEDRSLELRAEATQSWALALGRRVSQPLTDESAAILKESLAKHRDTGRLYQRLAQLRATRRDYVELLWNSAENFFSGTDFTNAQLVLREYVSVESRPRRGEALRRLAVTELALGQREQGEQTLQRIIERMPQDAATPGARLLLAAERREQARYDEAAELLLANLTSALLTPSGDDWRQSLIAYGRLLYAMRRDTEAVDRLEEALTRYPNDIQAADLYYLAAEAHARLGSELAAQAAAAPLRKDQQTYNESASRHRTTALHQYEQALAALTEQRLESQDAHALQRNCLFGQAAVLADLRRYEEACDVYLLLVQRYQNSPVVLSAYTELAACYRAMQRPVQARQALTQAQIVLERLPANADFASLTNFSRAQWSQQIERLATL